MTNIKVIEKIGNNPGKNIVILAGVHGNEKFGVKMLKKLIPKLNILKGKVTFIYANLKAIKQNKRFVECNLNRCFLINQPQEITESLEGKTAKEIMPYLDKADLMLDLHASFTADSIPFIICDKQSFEFAQVLPFEIVSYNWDEFEPGSTDYYMNLQNKIGICVECGYLSDKESEIRGEKALLNFLSNAGAIDFKIQETPPSKFYQIIDLYKNKKGRFKKSRDFADFEILKEKTLVGLDGDKKIFADKNEILIFVRDAVCLGEECFIKAKQTLLNSKELNNLKKSELKW